jgi:tRNA(adenine34) deaminase
MDAQWMTKALALAQRAEAEGEVPVGAVLVLGGELIGAGWNRPIATSDPSAHAEIQALRAAGQQLSNYRLCGTTLYVTLEPCVMCAGALVQARIGRLVYGAADPKGGAAGSCFDLLPPDGRFNTSMSCEAGLFAEESGQLLKAFFRRRR